MFFIKPGKPTKLKEKAYLSASMILGLLLSVLAHSFIEINYLNWLSSRGSVATFYGACALPPLLQISLPIFGVLGGLILGRSWWRSIYADKKSLTLTLIVIGTAIILVAAAMICLRVFEKQNQEHKVQTQANTTIDLYDGKCEPADMIRVSEPGPNQLISSPVTIKGEACGSWFFEASFPVFLVDWDGRIIAQGIAQAKGDWMTTEFVPFEAKLEFSVAKDIYSRNGTLILKKDNPSGLPANDAAIEVPVVFAN